jgi:rSAM/selenodomain-associated transferase 2
MIAVVVPTLNSERTLVPVFAALVPAAMRGLVREVVVVDGGSTDDTEAIADAAGATFVTAERGRGAQLQEGACVARSDWLLFLHADTVLEPGWEGEVEAFIDRVEQGRQRLSAAAFRFTLDDDGLRPRLLQMLVGLRCAVFRLPYGDQGLLIPRRLYSSLGGFRAMPLMEDVDLVRRLGRGRLHMLRARAVTSASRYRQRGYAPRALRNAALLALYYLRVSPRLLARYYE